MRAPYTRRVGSRAHRQVFADRADVSLAAANSARATISIGRTLGAWASIIIARLGTLIAAIPRVPAFLANASITGARTSALCTAVTTITRVGSITLLTLPPPLPTRFFSSLRQQ